METRHPAGRGCWGGATAILLIAGVLTATAFGILHAVATDGPALPASTPAGLVQQLPATTTAPPATTTAAANSAPAVAPRAVAAEPTTTTEDTVAPQPSVNPTHETDANGVRVAPDPNSDPNKNVKPTPAPQNGLDPEGNPVVPQPPGGQPPQN